MRGPEVLVVGSGPNGLAAAVRLAEEGLSVRVVESSSTPGGGCRTSELTLPGFHHDVCAAAHPLGAASPFFLRLGLERHGLSWIHPEVVAAHPVEGGCAAGLWRNIAETKAELGIDGDAWEDLVGPFAENFAPLCKTILGPLLVPRHPLLAARFARVALRSARELAEERFRTERARLLFVGLAAHAKLPLDRSPGASFGLVLAAAAHAVGWPLAAGGSASITDALAARLSELGGRIDCDSAVGCAADVERFAPGARAVLFDLTPRRLLDVAGGSFPEHMRRKLARFRYGTGVFKLDWALREPIPWKDPVCRRAGTIHLGASVEEVARSESDAAVGRLPERPFVILVQPSLFDPGRAPSGRHTVWAYCHAPSASGADLTAVVEAQVERFAPGFREVVLARHSMTARDMEAYNGNYVGGDIGSGEQDLRQTLFRPFPAWNPYRLGVPGWYACSASTPPGGGVHGMCGLHAAETALSDLTRSGGGLP